MTTLQPDGSTQAVPKQSFFYSWQRRTETIVPRSCQCRAQTRMWPHTAGLALQVVQKGVMPGPAAAPAAATDPESHVLFKESDATWVRPTVFGGYDDWYKRTHKWLVKPHSEPHCVTVSDPRLVYCDIPYLEDRCPALPIAWALKRRGWKGVDVRCTHTTHELGGFDCTEATKMKCYYQVLYSLPTCMPLASSIPSRQPVLFYRILLAGTRVEPGLGNEEYNKCGRRL